MEDQKSSRLDSSAAPTILAVDTSSRRLGLALTSGCRQLAVLNLETDLPHSRQLFASLATLLKEADAELSALAALAVTTGPGSFTGLRVGLAAAKGLAHSLRRPLYGVSTFDAAALAAGAEGLIAVLLNASRGDLFCAVRQVSAEGELMKVGRDRVAPAEIVLTELSEELRGRKATILGEAAITYHAELCRRADIGGTEVLVAAHPDAEFRGWQLLDRIPPLAPAVAARALRLLRANAAPEAMAYYLRPADAELKVLEPPARS